MAPDAEAAEEQARARVTLLIRRAGRGLLRMTPYAILGTLCAGAMVPLAAVGIGGVAGAGLQVLGGVGGNILAGVIAQAMESLRLRTGCGDPAPDEIEREIADRLAAMLVGDSEQSAALRRAVAAVLHRIDAPDVAMAAIDQDGDKQLQEHLTAAFARLGSEFAEFRVLLDDVDRKAGQILDELRVQAAEHGSDRDLTLRMLTQLREDIAAISDRAPDGPQKAVAAHLLRTGNGGRPAARPGRAATGRRGDHRGHGRVGCREVLPLASRAADRAPAAACPDRRTAAGGPLW